MTPDEFREDLLLARKTIEDVTSEPVIAYRAPSFSITSDSLWALDILIEEGFQYDSSIFPIHHDKYGIPNAERFPHRIEKDGGSLWEFPPMVGVTPLTNLPFGGGWGLRVFPYRFIRTRIRNLNRKDRPGVVFLHPREFDARNPKIRLPPAKRFVLNAGVERTEKRLERLLRDFSFTSISTFLENRHSLL